MKIRLVYIQSSKEPWAESAEELYAKKLSGFGKFEVLPIKAKSLSRGDSETKKKAESDLLLSKLEPSDINFLFDERGRQYGDSRLFANHIKKQIESSRRMSFFIGGAFGVTEEARSQFTEVLSLSNLVMNHHLAKTMVLEQLYRTMTIIKGIPYHND